MDEAAALDTQITREFSFIQELIWSPPYRNPFPLCSNTILSRLKNRRDTWKRAPLTAQKTAASLLKILDADMSTLIDLRRQYLKLLSYTSDSNSAAKLEYMVDGLMVQHMEDAWKKPEVELLESEAQQIRKINHEALTEAVTQCFLDYASHHCTKENARAKYNAPVTEAGDSDEALGITTEIQATSLKKQFTSKSDKHSSVVSDEEPKSANSQIESVKKDAGSQATIKQPAATEKSTAGSEENNNHSVTRIDVEEDAAEQATQVGQSSFGDDGYFLASSDEEPISIKTRVANICKDAANRATTVVKPSASKSDEYLSDTLDEVTHPPTTSTPGTEEIHVLVDTIHTNLKSSTGRTSSNEEEKLLTQGRNKASFVYESANDSLSYSEDTEVYNELQSNLGRTANLDAKQLDASEEVLMQAKDDQSTLTEGCTEDVNPTAAETSIDGKERIQLNLDTLETSEFTTIGALTENEQELFIQAKEKKIGQKEKGSALSRFATRRMSDMEPEIPDGNGLDPHMEFSEAPVRAVSTIADGNESLCEKLSGGVGQPPEVEMNLRAKICAVGCEEPYWHVVFGLVNHSSYKISVHKLSYWSLDSQEDVTCVTWPQGEMILREQPSFLCYSIKVPCLASFDSPQMAFSWHYSKFPEWIPTRDSRGKAEKVSLRKRLGSLLSLGDPKKKMKHDNGNITIASTQGRK